MLIDTEAAGLRHSARRGRRRHGGQRRADLAVGSARLRAQPPARVVSGREELIGATGEGSTMVEADGLWSHVHGEYWQARSRDAPLAARARRCAWPAATG